MFILNMQFFCELYLKFCWSLYEQTFIKEIWRESIENGTKIALRYKKVQQVQH